MSKCGVYRIKCLRNGRFYVGSSKDVYVRVHQHLLNLRRGSHVNVILQRVFNKHGEETLEFKFKLTRTLKGAHRLEQHYLDLYRSDPKCMNIGRSVWGGDNLTNHPKRDSIVRKIQTSLNDRIDRMSDSERRATYSRAGEKNPMYGKHHTEDTRRKISAAHSGNHYCLGVKKSEIGRQNIAKAAQRRVASPDYVNPFQGRHHSKKTKQILSDANKGNVPPNARPVKIGKKTYRSLTAAARGIGVVPATVLYRIRSKHFTDYSYVG